MLQHQLDSEPLISILFCENLLEDLLSSYDVSGAMWYLSLVAAEFIYIAEEATNLNANDYREITRIKGGRLIEKFKVAKPGNVRPALRRVQLSIFLTNLL